MKTKKQPAESQGTVRLHFIVTLTETFPKSKRETFNSLSFTFRLICLDGSSVYVEGVAVFQNADHGLACI